LDAYLKAIEGKPQNTEVERLVVQRIGQAQFRKALLDYWDGSCCVTGIKDTELLRASHIKPWARCESDEERLDVHNGLLLSALWDAAFDKGLVTFDADMRAEFSPRLSQYAKQALGSSAAPSLPKMTAQHVEYLNWHRRYLFLKF
jgi:predicted restriction endonuclease